MGFIQIISQKKIALTSIFLLIYVLLNLLDGERGLISFYEKKKIKEQLLHEKKMLVSELSIVERKNNLLKNKVDLDYLEILYRKKFLVGKSKEKIYKIK